MTREEAFEIVRSNAREAKDNPWGYDDPVEMYRANAHDTLNEKGCTDWVMHDLAMQEFDRAVAA
jgi:hypothetical protein